MGIDVDMDDGGVVLDPAGPAGGGSYRERMPYDGLVEGMTVADVDPGLMSRLLADVDAYHLPGGRGLEPFMPSPDPDVVWTVPVSAAMLSSAIGGTAGCDVIAGMPAGRGLALARYVADTVRTGGIGKREVDTVASILTGMPSLTVRMAAIMGAALREPCSGGNASSAFPPADRLYDVLGSDAGAVARGMAALTVLSARGCDPRLWDDSGFDGGCNPVRVLLAPFAVSDGVDVALSRLAAALGVEPDAGDWRMAGRLCREAYAGGGLRRPGLWAFSLPGVAAADDPGVRRALVALSSCILLFDRDGGSAGVLRRLETLAGLGVSAAGMPDGFLGECVAAEGFDPACVGLMFSGSTADGVSVFPDDGDEGWMAAFCGFLAEYGHPLCVPAAGSWFPSGLVDYVAEFNNVRACGPAIAVEPAPVPRGYLRG